MGVETKKVVINGSTWQFNTFSGTKTIGVLKTLFKLIGEPLTFFMTNTNNGEIDSDKLSQAIKTVLLNLDDIDLPTFCKDLIESATKENKPIIFDAEFSGNIDVLFTLIAEIIKANYSGFFSKAALKVAGLSGPKA